MQPLNAIIDQYGKAHEFPPAITLVEENKVGVVIRLLWTDTFSRPVIRALLESPRPLSLTILKKLIAASEEEMRLIMEMLAKEGIVHITGISGEKPRPSLSHSLSDREKALLSAYLDYSNFYRELAQAEAKQHRRRPILRRADLIEQSSTL
jgi:hypothetical protein